jgi:hypothetical protein
VPGGDRRQAGQVEGETARRLPIGVAVAWSWCRVAGKPRLPWSGQCWRCSITGSSSGSSSSRLVKPATRRRRRQCRAVPGGDRRQAGQGDGETAHRQPIGRAVAWSVLAVLDHRQFGRVFVLSIGEAGHGATTAPVSSSAGWRSPASGPGRRRDGTPAADRACRGLVVVSGGWQAAVAVVWSVLAGLDHRHFFRFFVLSIGEAGHEAMTAPGSSSTGWRSPASGPGRRRGSATAADRAGRGLVRVSECSITGSSSGPLSSRSVQPATRR